MAAWLRNSFPRWSIWSGRKPICARSASAPKTISSAANLPSLIKLIDIRAKLPLDQAVKEAIEAGRKYMRAGSADLG